MARWKLMTPHYLNVEGEEWEYQETNRTTGRPQRTKFPVPRLLDIRDPQCWTNQWGNKAPAFTTDEVKKLREALPEVKPAAPAH